MAQAAVQTAIYELGYKTSDSTKQLNETRAAADQLVKSTEQLSVSEEKVTKATRVQADAMDRLLGRLDPRIRAEQNLQRVQEQVQRIQQQGIGTTQQHARAIELAQQKVDRFAAANDNVRGSFGRMSEGLGKVNGLLGVFGITISGVAIVSFAKDVFNAASSLDELAQQAGVSTEGLQAYRAVMLESGIAVGDTDRLLQRLTRTIGEAKEGAGKQRDAFVALGLSANDLAGGAEGALPKIAAALLKIDDATRRAALETDLFGKTGQKLESALRALLDPTSTLIEKQRALGQVMGTDVTKAADLAADRMTLAWNKLKVASAPTITWLVEKMTQIVELSNRLDRATNWMGRGDAARAAEQPGKIQLYSGPFNLAKAPWLSTEQEAAARRAATEAAAAAKKAAADAKRIDDAKQIQALDSEIAKTAEETVKFALKQNEYKQDYIEKQEKLASDTDQYLADLETEVKLAGMSREQREIELAVMEGMRVSGGAINREQVEGLVRARQETEQWRDVVDDISRGFERMFEDIFETGKLSFDSLWDSVKSSFFRMLSQMASQQFIQPLIGSLFGGGNSPLAGGGRLTGGLTSLFSGSNGPLSFLSGGSGFLDFLNPGIAGNGVFGGLFGGGAASPFTFGADPSGLFSGGGASLFGGGGGLGSMLGGAGLGSLAGSLIFGNKNSAGIASMGGAAAGALIGSIVPGIGTIIGGLAGGLLGGGLGSITGTSNQGAISNFTNGGLGNTLFKAGGGNNGAMATQATGQINAAIKALQDAGVSVSLGNISGLSIGSDKSYVYDFAGGKQKLAGGEAGVAATVNAIMDRILPGASATSATAQAILAKNGGLNSGNLQQVLQDLGAAQQLMDAINGLSVGNDNLSEAERAIKAINAQIDPLVQQAHALGIATDKLEQVRGSAIQQIRDAEDQAKAAAEAAQAQAELTQAYKVVADSIGDVIDQAQEMAQSAQRAADMWGGAFDSLTAASRALMISDQSLSPGDRYRNSAAEFGRLQGLVMSGDASAAGDLAGFAGQYLQSSFAYNGSTTAYGADFANVRSVLSDAASFSSSQQSLAQRQADSAVQSAAALSALLQQAVANNNELVAVKGELEEIKGSMARMGDAVALAVK